MPKFLVQFTIYYLLFVVVVVVYYLLFVVICATISLFFCFLFGPFITASDNSEFHFKLQLDLTLSDALRNQFVVVVVVCGSSV